VRFLLLLLPFFLSFTPPPPLCGLVFRQSSLTVLTRSAHRKDSQGNPKIAVILNSTSSSSSAASPSLQQQQPAFPGRRPPPPGSVGVSVPTEYKLTMQNTESKNLFVFGEKIEEVEETGEEGARKKRRTSSFSS
jgi:hypothetical protein